MTIILLYLSDVMLTSNFIRTNNNPPVSNYQDLSTDLKGIKIDNKFYNVKDKKMNNIIMQKYHLNVENKIIRAQNINQLKKLYVNQNNKSIVNNDLELRNIPCVKKSLNFGRNNIIENKNLNHEDSLIDISNSKNGINANSSLIIKEIKNIENRKNSKFLNFQNYKMYGSTNNIISREMSDKCRVYFIYGVLVFYFISAFNFCFKLNII